MSFDFTILSTPNLLPRHLTTGSTRFNGMPHSPQSTLMRTRFQGNGGFTGMATQPSVINTLMRASQWSREIAQRAEIERRASQFYKTGINTLIPSQAFQLSPTDFYRQYKNQVPAEKLIPLFLPAVHLNPTQQKRALAALESALAGALVVQNQWNQKHTIETKENRWDLVSETDKASDIEIQQILKRYDGQADLVTEETPYHGKPQPAGRGPYPTDNTWFVDPLDGTMYFLHHFPGVDVSIGHVENGVPDVGVILNVSTGDITLGIRGVGAWLNQKPIGTSAITDLSNALLVTDMPKTFATSTDPKAQNLSNFIEMSKQAQGVRREGAARTGVLAAQGSIEGFWQVNTTPWDVAAAHCIVEAAGGRVTDVFGHPIDYSLTTTSILGSANGDIHKAMQAITEANSLPISQQTLNTKG